MHSTVITGVRSFSVIIAILVIVSGVTFAALQSRDVALRGSRITSATADLQISKTSNNFAAETAGYNFDNVEPGGTLASASKKDLYLKNTGSTNLALRLGVDPAMLHNAQNAGLDKVFLTITEVDTGISSEHSLASLVQGQNSANPPRLNLVLPAGQIGFYRLQVTMTAAAVPAVAGGGVTIDNIDLMFSGETIPQT